MKLRIGLYYAFFLLYLIMAFKRIWITSQGYASKIFGIDFSIFWVASQLTLAGTPDLVFNMPIHHQGIESVYHTSISYVLAYFYPPYTLFFFLPLALVPFYLSFATWHILGLILYGCFIWKVFRNKVVLAMAFSFFGIFFNLLWGQNAMFITALLLGFIYYLDRNSFVAGIFLGILCFKPQLAFFCFIAMLAARNWRCIITAVTIPITLSLASIVIWGTTLWPAYFDLTKNFAEVSLLSGWADTSAVQPTFYSLFRLFGMPYNIALVIQYVIFAIMIGVVYFTWRKRSAGDLLAVQILIFCILIGLPYYIQYDMLIAIIPISIYWVRRSVQSPKTNMFLMHFLWVMPLLSYLVVHALNVQIAPIGFAIGLVLAMREFIKDATEDLILI